MNLENLQEQQEIKNYKELCKLLDWNVSSGNTKKAQFKELDRYCLYHKNGNKFIIDKIFEEPRDKQDLRNKYGIDNNGWKDYEQFKISYEEKDNIGIYYIVKDNDIYIGSTIVGFRDRFRNHYYGYEPLMKHTYEMLQNGGEFHILYNMTGIEDEVLIRQIEDEYINYFKNYTNYNIINKIDKAWSSRKKNEVKIKYKTIRIKVLEYDYDKVIQFLIEHGLYGNEV